MARRVPDCRESFRSSLPDRGTARRLARLRLYRGQNITIESRSANGDYDRLPELAAELARLKVDVIVSFGAKALMAAKRATTTIPIVIPSIGDPVAAGFASSLASPGGNIVGSDNMNSEIYGKRLELLKETVPRISNVALLLNPAQTTSGALKATRNPARSLKLEIQPFDVRSSTGFGNAFSAMAKARIDAIVVGQDTLFGANAREIADLATKQRLPSVGNKEYAEAGGLIGYGTIDAELYRRAAYFVDRILKGTKPSDLPIERAMRFELVINMKTAKTIGIRIPEGVLLRADKVIE